jgi:hypothetical protein
VINRASFFKTCAAFVAGCAMNVGALASSVRNPKREDGWIENPAWKDAEYEIFWCFETTQVTTGNRFIFKDGKFIPVANRVKK